jgi:hypothetical protein
VVASNADRLRSRFVPRKASFDGHGVFANAQCNSLAPVSPVDICVMAFDSDGGPLRSSSMKRCMRAGDRIVARIQLKRHGGGCGRRWSGSGRNRARSG